MEDKFLIIISILTTFVSLGFLIFKIINNGISWISTIGYFN